MRGMVTFGPMVQAGPGNGGCMCVYRDGVEVGVIESEHDDVGATSIVYRVCCYSVTLWTQADADRDFEVKRGKSDGYTSARAALAAAKRHVRATLTAAPAATAAAPAATDTNPLPPHPED